MAGPRKIGRGYGIRVAAWRYDRIFLIDYTGFTGHEACFIRLMRKLSGLTDGIVIFFAKIYRKMVQNIDSTAKQRIFRGLARQLNRKR